jgi:hypothetical protein
VASGLLQSLADGKRKTLEPVPAPKRMSSSCARDLLVTPKAHSLTLAVSFCSEVNYDSFTNHKCLEYIFPGAYQHGLGRGEIR